MQERLFEMVAMGPALRDEAKRLGKGVNESYLLVHRVLSEAFQEDLKRISGDELREHLSTRLKKRMRDKAA